MAFNVSVDVWESDVNINDNSSIAHVRVTITTTGESHSNYDHYGTIVIDGNSYSHGAYRLPYTTTKTFESSRKITHNGDGSKSINWSYSFPVKSDDTRTGSGTLSLTTIARASQPSVSSSSVNLGSQITINTNRATNNFTHTITYAIGSLTNQTTGLGASTGVGASTTFTPPADLAKQFPNATSGTVTITCKTYNGSTLLGTKTCTLTVKTIDNSTYKPTMRLSASPSNLFHSKYLNKVSGVTVSATTGGKYNATISSYSISGLSKTASKANLVVSPINENITNASQLFTISGSVTDSRGYTYNTSVADSTSVQITVYRYNAPQITQYSVQRCTSNGTVSNNGTYAKVGITYKYQNDGYSNTMPTKKININNTDYNLTTTETTSNGVVTGTGYTVVGGGNLAITNKYNYTITCIDEVGKSITSQGVLNTSERIVSIRPRGKGIAFGMFATDDNLLESAWEIKAPKITSTGEGVLAQGTRVRTINAGSGTSGYFNVCTFTINASYVNQPILLGITQRSRSGDLKIQFDSVNNKEPSLSTFTKTGNINAYMYKASASVWNLYIQKSEAYDNLEVTELHKGAYMGNVAIAWVNSIVTSVPSGYITASKQYIATRTILYDSSTGTTGNVTLSRNASNFDYIDIYYSKGTGTNKCARIYNPNGKYVNIDLFLRQDNLFQFQTKRLYINGTSITYTQTGIVNIEGSTFATYTSNEIQIMRVEGWA